MKLFLTSTSIIAVAAVLAFASGPANAKGTHKGSAQTSFGKMKLTFKNGRVNGGGYRFENKVMPDGSVQLSFQGETAIIGADGSVRGRGGAKTGPHTCDMAQVHQALKK
ncbi:hypothetical protein N9Z87_01190 [Amylibacter sp.]|jgi:hypothetical protein|nr:hypothetical protein [Amylibacter sp.]